MNLPSNQEIIKMLCEKSYLEFTKYSWRVMEPMTPMEITWDHELVCEYLEACKLRQIKRLLINIPPRVGKSYKAHMQLIPWWWIDEPHTKFIKASYADRLSKNQNVKTRDLIQSSWYQSNWGDRYSLKDDLNTQTRFDNNKTGMSMSTSVGGQVTGDGGDVIIFDDPHNPKQAESDAERQSAVDFFGATMQNRLNNLREGIIIVVMQRLHDQDVSGHILANDAGYEHLCLPMEEHERRIISFPLSKREIIREPGDILQPNRFSKEILTQLQRDMGSYSYAGQYQQDPTPKGGGMFKKWWWRYWQPKGMNLPPVQREIIDSDGKRKTIYIEPVTLPDTEEQAQSWDLAFKSNATNDNVAGEVWERKGADRFLIHLDEQKRSFTQTLTAIKAMTDAYPNARRKLVEDKANGPAVIDTLKSSIQGLIPINPGNDSKEARAESVTPQIESGNVYLPHPALYTWVDPFIENAAKFPRVSNDDSIDSMVQMLIYWSKPKATIRVREF